MQSSQKGFTLIELIVVIVILGILAATALPRFVNLSGDARAATMKGVAASMEGAKQMVQGKWLATGSATAATVSIDGTTSVAVITGATPATNGMPTAAAAGMGTAITLPAGAVVSCTGTGTYTCTYTGFTSCTVTYTQATGAVDSSGATATNC